MACRVTVFVAESTDHSQRRTFNMKNSLLGASAAIALLAAAPASATNAITYVPNSLTQSVIKHGPWTLHEANPSAFYQHDASGIVPTKSGPPYTVSATSFL
jgi:hypothetical protein